MKTARPDIGSSVPDFTLFDGEGVEWTLSKNRGHTVVLLFYPGDDTPVCTRQMCSIRDHWSEYQATGAEILGVSTNSVESHRKFIQKYRLPLRLLSDNERKVSSMFGMRSWIPGRAARGVVVIDREGKLAYRKVQPTSLFRPADDEVLRAIKQAE